MKKLIFCILLLFTSCVKDKDRCLRSVEFKFPNSKIYTPINGSDLNFVVIDSVNIYFVTTGYVFSSAVSEVTVLREQ